MMRRAGWTVTEGSRALSRQAARPLSVAVLVVGFLGSIGTLWQIYGNSLLVNGTAGAFIFVLVLILNTIRRQRRLDEHLHADLPDSHAFLVEFLATTYAPARRLEVHRKNSGLTIRSYKNSFVVDGTNCKNYQEIEGYNSSDGVVTGLAIPLVGGSSIDSSSLMATYRIKNGDAHKPDFVIDEERYKVAFCQFDVPLRPQQPFQIRYTDDWPGSMRAEGDAFFFPESLYFPAGVQRLESSIEFSSKIRSAIVLECDLDTSEVGHCESIPALEVAGEFRSIVQWSINSPRQSVVYILYFRA